MVLKPNWGAAFMTSFPRDSSSPNPASDLTPLRHVRVLCFCWLLPAHHVWLQILESGSPAASSSRSKHLPLLSTPQCLSGLSGSCSLRCLLVHLSASLGLGAYSALQMLSGHFFDLLHPRGHLLLKTFTTLFPRPLPVCLSIRPPGTPLPPSGSGLLRPAAPLSRPFSFFPRL